MRVGLSHLAWSTVRVLYAFDVCRLTWSTVSIQYSVSPHEFPCCNWMFVFKGIASDVFGWGAQRVILSCVLFKFWPSLGAFGTLGLFASEAEGAEASSACIVWCSVRGGGAVWSCLRSRRLQAIVLCPAPPMSATRPHAFLEARAIVQFLDLCGVDFICSTRMCDRGTLQFLILGKSCLFAARAQATREFILIFLCFLRQRRRALLLLRCHQQMWRWVPHAFACLALQCRSKKKNLQDILSMNMSACGRASLSGRRPTGCSREGSQATDKARATGDCLPMIYLSL